MLRSSKHWKNKQQNSKNFSPSFYSLRTLKLFDHKIRFGTLFGTKSYSLFNSNALNELFKSIQITILYYLLIGYLFFKIVMVVRLIEQTAEDGKAENLDTKIQGNNVYAKFESDISRIFKSKPASPASYYETVNKRATTKQAAFNLKRNEKISMWIENRDLACKCPQLSVSRKYLIMTKS